VTNHNPQPQPAADKVLALLRAPPPQTQTAAMTGIGVRDGFRTATRKTGRDTEDSDLGVEKG